MSSHLVNGSSNGRWWFLRWLLDPQHFGVFYLFLAAPAILTLLTAISTDENIRHLVRVMLETRSETSGTNVAFKKADRLAQEGAVLAQPSGPLAKQPPAVNRNSRPTAEACCAIVGDDGFDRDDDFGGDWLSPAGKKNDGRKRGYGSVQQLRKPVRLACACKIDEFDPAFRGADY